MPEVLLTTKSNALHVKDLFFLTVCMCDHLFLDFNMNILLLIFWFLPYKWKNLSNIQYCFQQMQIVFVHFSMNSLCIPFESELSEYSARVSYDGSTNSCLNIWKQNLSSNV